MSHKEALEKAADRLRVASRRFAEMGNDSFSAVVLDWYQEARQSALSPLAGAAERTQVGVSVWAVYHNDVFQCARSRKIEAEAYASGFSTPCAIVEMVLSPTAPASTATKEGKQ